MPRKRTSGRSGDVPPALARLLERQSALGVARALSDLANATLEAQRQLQHALLAVHKILEDLEAELRLLQDRTSALERLANSSPSRR